MNKSFRTLDIFYNLTKGQVVKKKELTAKFLVDNKTIQRDIEEIRSFLGEADPAREQMEVVYQKKDKGYVLKHSPLNWLAKEEVLLLTKIILESRSFPVNDMNDLLDKLVSQALPEERDCIRDIIKNEKYYYVSVNENISLYGIVWDLGNAVREQRKLSLEYLKVQEKEPVKRLVHPVGLVFSEYYFYLIAFIEGYERDFPAVFRIDRIKKYTLTDEHFPVVHKNRFEEGQFRRRVQFMQPGKLMKVEFLFWGESVQAMLDRLPTARVKEKEGDKYRIEAEVYGRGIMMWFLSQGEYLEVIKPEGLRSEIARRVKEMWGVYFDI